MPDNTPKFTPGPLKCEHRIECSIVSRAEDQFKRGYADRRLATFHEVDGVSFPSREQIEERKANGLLYAAAPDLYEACKAAVRTLELMRLCSESPNDNGTCGQLKAALAKAEGRDA